MSRITTSQLAFMLCVCLAVICGAQLSAADVPHPLVASYFHPDRFLKPASDAQEQTRIIREVLDRHQRSGLNAIFAYFSGSAGQAYYASKIYPRPVYTVSDPMPILLQEARARNLKVYAVICVAVSGGEQPAGILERHPEWACRHLDGTPLGYISHAVPAAREWITSCAREIAANYHPDGIILDYIRYHNRPQLLDAVNEERFRSSLPPNCSESVRKARLQEFKEQELTELVRMIREATIQADPKTALGIYSWGPHVVQNHQIAQCWPLWVERGYLDLVNVSGYYHQSKYGDKYLSLFEQRMRETLEINNTLSKPVPISFALGVNTSHGRLTSAAEVAVYLDSAAKLKMPGVVLFTWHDLLPFLDDLDKLKSIPLFKNTFLKN